MHNHFCSTRTHLRTTLKALANRGQIAKAGFSLEATSTKPYLVIERQTGDEGAGYELPEGYAPFQILERAIMPDGSSILLSQVGGVEVTNLFVKARAAKAILNSGNANSRQVRWANQVLAQAKAVSTRIREGVVEVNGWMQDKTEFYLDLAYACTTEILTPQFVGTDGSASIELAPTSMRTPAIAFIVKDDEFTLVGDVNPIETSWSEIDGVERTELVAPTFRFERDENGNLTGLKFSEGNLLNIVNVDGVESAMDEAEDGSVEGVRMLKIQPYAVTIHVEETNPIKFLNPSNNGDASTTITTTVGLRKLDLTVSIESGALAKPIGYAEVQGYGERRIIETKPVSTVKGQIGTELQHVELAPGSSRKTYVRTCKAPKFAEVAA